MTDKDPKDITASEILRDCARRSTRPELAASEYYFPETYVDDYTCDLCGLFRAIADKIDAELAQARKESLLQGAQVWAKANGWPDFREGEDFGAWLDRCTIPFPRFEDGEPVQISDMEEIGALATYRVYMDGSWEFEPDKYEDERNPKPWDVQFGARNDRVRRPAPEALGADGLPIREGETVWDVYRSGPAEVYRIGPADDEDGPVVWDIEGNYTMPYLLTHERPVLGADGLPLKVGECVYGVGSRFKKFPIVSVHRAGDTINGITADSDFVMYEEGYDWAEDLTHTPPETQERIDRDAALPAREYYARHIGHDVAEKGAVEVHAAVTAHLLKRQRELDAKGAI